MFSLQVGHDGGSVGVFLLIVMLAQRQRGLKRDGRNLPDVRRGIMASATPERRKKTKIKALLSETATRFA